MKTNLLRKKIKIQKIVFFIDKIEYTNIYSRKGAKNMPFINSKVSVKMTEEQKETIKSKLGLAITTLGKSESWLMVVFEDDYCLYFKGEKSDKIAMIDVALYGRSNDAAYNKFTAQICEIFGEVLQIPANQIYVKYEEVEHWGWNGGNF